MDLPIKNDDSPSFFVCLLGGNHPSNPQQPIHSRHRCWASAKPRPRPEIPHPMPTGQSRCVHLPGAEGFFWDPRNECGKPWENIQDGAPQLCLLVYKPHEYYGYIMLYLP